MIWVMVFAGWIVVAVALAIFLGKFIDAGNRDDSLPTIVPTLP